jgi:hypothetical protein
VFERRAHDVFLGKAEMQFGPLVEFEDEPVDVGGKNDVGGVLEDAVEVIGLVLYPPDRQHDFFHFLHITRHVPPEPVNQDRNQGGDHDGRTHDRDPGLNEYSDRAEHDDQDSEGYDADDKCFINGETVEFVVLRGKEIVLFHEWVSLPCVKRRPRRRTDTQAILKYWTNGNIIK